MSVFFCIFFLLLLHVYTFKCPVLNLEKILKDDFEKDYKFTNCYFTIYDVEQCKTSKEGCYMQNPSTPYGL